MGSIDLIHPVGQITIMSHSDGSWYLLGRGGRAIFRKSLNKKQKSTSLQTRFVSQGIQRWLAWDLSLWCLALTPMLVPTLDSFYPEPVCIGLNPMQLLKENYQPQVQQGLYQPNQVYDNEFARVLKLWNQSAIYKTSNFVKNERPQGY